MLQQSPKALMWWKSGKILWKFWQNVWKPSQNSCCWFELQTWHPKSKCRQFEESLQTFLNELLVLSKTCNFQDVAAEVYRNELVRDAFMNGLKSHEIPQRRLENNEVTLDQVFDIANSFDTALEHWAAYLSHEKGMSAAVAPGDDIYQGWPTCLRVGSTRKYRDNSRSTVR